jgi:hypothetical protein
LNSHYFSPVVLIAKHYTIRARAHLVKDVGAGLVGDFGFWILDFGLGARSQLQNPLSKIQNPKSKIFDKPCPYTGRGFRAMLPLEMYET